MRVIQYVLYSLVFHYVIFHEGLLIPQAPIVRSVVAVLTKQHIQQICEEIQQDTRVQGILLAGSYVYGTPHEHSDLDLHIVTNDGTTWRDKQSRPFGTQADFYYYPPEAVRGAFAKEEANR